MFWFQKQQSRKLNSFYVRNSVQQNNELHDSDFLQFLEIATARGIRMVTVWLELAVFGANFRNSIQQKKESRDFNISNCSIFRSRNLGASLLELTISGARSFYFRNSTQQRNNLVIPISRNPQDQFIPRTNSVSNLKLAVIGPKCAQVLEVAISSTNLFRFQKQCKTEERTL